MCSHSLVPHSAHQVLSLQVVIAVFEQANDSIRKITDALWVTRHITGKHISSLPSRTHCGPSLGTDSGLEALRWHYFHLPRVQTWGITTCKWIRSALTTSLFHPHRIGRCFGFGLIELWLAGHTDLSTSSITAASRCPIGFFSLSSY